MLGDPDGQVRVRCEVTDVASTSTGQNGKEVKDLMSLGCQISVPVDGSRRFICTSSEFAKGLSSRSRKWDGRHYRYDTMPVDGTDTWLLEIQPIRKAV